MGLASEIDDIADGISHGSLTETSTSGFETSDGTSSSSSSRPGSGCKKKEKTKMRVKRKKLLLRSMRPRCVYPVPYEPIMYRGEKRHRTFALFPQFVSLDEINQIHKFSTHDSVKQIEDRTNGLTYQHIAYRVELQARRFAPALYDKLINAIQWTDSQIWQKLPKTCFPELEYIVYDKELQGGRAGYIEEHVDNKSAVTFVVMLSHQREFVGGVNYFARCEKHGIPRCVTDYCTMFSSRGIYMALQQGDMVVFRGERLLHWISPVPRGRRVIFQGEMSRV
eukprot:GEMP01091025.1.p1 GENE.GEMP01091025.1~~GEMP01091025.1.p1  ORF type:complete len:280 (+),score=42.49 GEMP01091025.1:42-881(+)